MRRKALLINCITRRLAGCLVLITLLFTGVVIAIARRLDGVFEDQINYLLRVNREQEEEKESY